MVLTDPEFESSVLISSDEGASYQKYRLGFYVLSLLFHPEKEDWILAYSHDQKERRHCIHQNSPQWDATMTARQTNTSEEPLAAGHSRGMTQKGRPKERQQCVESRSMFKVLVEVSYKGCLFSTSALVDLGAAGNVMDWGFAKRLGIESITLLSSLSVQALDGGPVGPGYITHVTPHVLLIIEGEHMECIAFFLLPSLSHPLTLGLPWLWAHNPQVLWTKNQILQ
ncbi:hypothetical protein P4O66_004226 [Electrophorus voltai]|uniref:Peptidase A2 domain-containing protein n=1 Tax=Electrophorus voltai TaxID=2609070 RepID=A0AAD9E335_9TELE|nr:hypothetical protein P4O66_004226 [Electrophorus voltai]